MFEGLSLEFHQRFSDDGFFFAFAAFNVHHHGKRDAAAFPVLRFFGQLAHGREIAGAFVKRQHRRVVAQRVGVVGVKGGRHAAAAFVPEEVGDGGELAVVLAFFFHFGQFRAQHFHQQFFGFNQRHLYVAVRIAVQHQLAGDAGRQGLHQAGQFGGQFGDDKRFLFRNGGHLGQFGFVVGQRVVKRADEFFHFRDKFNQPFRHEHHAEVFAGFGAFGNQLGQIVHHLAERHFFSQNFFANQYGVGLGFKGHFQRNVRGASAHQAHEVPVFARGVDVAADVAHELGVNFGGGVKTERGFNLFVFKVAVNGLRHADDADVHALLF